ncbi:hypothetical protein DV451_004604 [Geotrichum candidum]|uniref:Uncharacterized protein n=1 Tax=Geotrichum candidum TaxID=1173061 RepID=A0A9P5G1L0_GEOCN|nr:hypothetical protein DV451_004604 [Geotrichum candidum]KAF5109171.1 hypothetical protein DV453_001849 [Geotrichum candidum]KAF5119811.1 hypothetical protein DV452_001452 [Geotrichum candidum]KAI8132711.1 hypothetical protein DUD61_003630 [Geotrichum candidum]KAI9213444.1 hypothetical protein DS838_001705 [Geotrichum bryndzae]
MSSSTVSPQASTAVTSSNNNKTAPIESYEERSAVSLNARPTLLERIIKNLGLAGAAQVPASDNTLANTDQRFIVVADNAEDEFSEIQVRPLSYAEMAARGTSGAAETKTNGSIELPLSAVYDEQEHYEIDDDEEDFSNDDSNNQQRPLEESLSELSPADIDNNGSVAPPVKAEYLQGHRAEKLEKKLLRGKGNGGSKKSKKRVPRIPHLAQQPL